MSYEAFTSGFTSWVNSLQSSGIFLLIPLQALLLKVLFLRTRRRLLEHFVFAFHYTSFVLVVAVPALVTGSSWLGRLWFAVMFFYLVPAFRRVYGQSWTAAASKSVVFYTGWIVMIFYYLRWTEVLAAVLTANRS
jgi:hypothetical protein